MVDSGGERQAVSLPSGNLGVWALLQSALDDTPGKRPPNSVTPREYAERAGVSISHAGNVLRWNSKLRSVPYKTEDGRRAVCYVARESNE